MTEFTWGPTGFAFLLLIAALFLAFVRLVRGPSLPDRVVALDLIATLAVGFTATYAMATDEPSLVDVAILLALISFLGTVAFALYVGRRGAP
jgi:multicomponent Na+:H+ antiporter subunit F